MTREDVIVLPKYSTYDIGKDFSYLQKQYFIFLNFYMEIASNTQMQSNMKTMELLLFSHSNHIGHFSFINFHCNI